MHNNNYILTSDGGFVSEDELYHHGVKGQRWGVRRYQDKNGSLTNAGKEHYKNINKTVNDSNAKNFVKVNSGKRIKDLPAGMSEEAVQFVSTLAAFTTMTAVSLGINKAREKSMRKSCNKEIEERYSERDPRSVSQLPKLKKKTSPEDSMKVTNPDYPNLGATMNCTFCTAAMAMREKGYNVKAQKTSHAFFVDDLYTKAFDGSSRVKMKAKTTSDIFSNLAKQGDNAYGNLDFSWKLGGGHSVFYKVINGKTHVYDGQNGKEYSKRDLDGYINNRSASYVRLDNCRPTDYVLGIVERAG